MKTFQWLAFPKKCMTQFSACMSACMYTLAPLEELTKEQFFNLRTLIATQKSLYYCNIRNHHELRTTKTLLENHTYIPGLIFHLYLVFCPPVQMMTFVPIGATNRYKCPLTKFRRGLIQPTRYKCLIFVPFGGSHCTNVRPTVANMASYSISSSLILVIHDNMINGTNHIV
jgi:hypothetical protein